MRNESEQQIPEIGTPEPFDANDWRSIRRALSKEELAKAYLRIKKQMLRMKSQRDQAQAKLNALKMSEDLGHEPVPRQSPNIQLAGYMHHLKCRLCSSTYSHFDRGVCAAKVNAKLDSIVAMDRG